MNVGSITSQILALPDTGCDETVARKLATDACAFFTKPSPRAKKWVKHDLAAKESLLPRTVVCTNSVCVYMLQTKGGARLLGKGTYSKVGRVIVVHENGVVSLDKGRVVREYIQRAQETNREIKECKSPYVDQAAWLTFTYWSKKKRADRCLFVGEILGFDTTSDQMKELPAIQQLSILADVATGLADMHEQDYVHNDPKPDNFLVRVNPNETGLKKYVGVLADVDFMKKAGSDRFGGSPYYIAPEGFRVFRSTKAQDMWAFGMSLYQILKQRVSSKDQGFPDFIAQCGKNNPHYRVFGSRLAKIGDEDLAPEKLFPQGWSILPAENKSVQSIIRACLRLDPAKRPSARQVAAALRDGSDLPDVVRKTDPSSCVLV